MNMRSLTLAVAMGLSGCLVPLDIDGDAGRDAGDVITHEDGGVVCDPPDAGAGIDWSGLPCTLPVLEAQQAGAVAVLLPGCKQPVQVFSPGAVFPAVVTTDAIGTRVASPQWPPGVYVIRTGTGADTREATLEVYARQSLTIGTVRPFSEPVDDCFRIGVTTAGRVVCERTSGSRMGITVYELDGSFARFAGEHLAIAGNEVWTLGGGGLELRVDGATGLVLRAAVVDARLMTGGGAVNFGETRPGRSVRGSSTELIEVTWDGVSNTLTTGTSVPLATSSSGFTLEEGGTLWNGAACRCSNGVCAQSPSSDCPYGNAVLAGFSGRAAFVAKAGIPTTVTEVVRPLGSVLPVELRRVVPLAQGVYFARPLFERPVFMTVTGAPEYVVLMNSDPGGQSTHFTVFSEPVLGVDQRQVVSLVDPTHLRFTPNP